MKKWMSGLVLAVVSMAASAGFIDERTANNDRAMNETVNSPAETHAPVPVNGSGSIRSQKWVILIEDVTLENTFKRWAEQANYQLLWDTDREIQIPAKDEFLGSFEEALARVLQSPAIRQSEHPLEAVIYSNNPPLVRITRMGEQ
jgi:O-glycosyl hydrolase